MPLACETLVRGPLAAEYYYVYAMDEHGGNGRARPLCVPGIVNSVSLGERIALCAASDRVF
jgi:uncharacterized membrane protein